MSEHLYNKSTDNDMIDLTEIVCEFVDEYRWHLNSQRPAPVSVGDGINSGLCDIFAERVRARFPHAEILYDDDIDHVFVKIDDKYYDAENPLGIADRRKMIFGGKCLSK